MCTKTIAMCTKTRSMCTKNNPMCTTPLALHRALKLFFSILVHIKIRSYNILSKRTYMYTLLRKKRLYVGTKLKLCVPCVPRLFRGVF